MTDKIIYSQNVIDFIAVSVEFCSLLENEKTEERNKWINKILRLLPLIYIKGTLLPATTENNEEPPQTFVKEEDYNSIRYSVSEIMGEEDVYLDFYVEDMKYSDRPVSSFVSEDIADIYQDLRNFVSIYQYKLEGQMNDAIHICYQNFKSYWGQKLVNVLRPLHALIYKDNEEDYDSFESGLNMEDLWD